MNGGNDEQMKSLKEKLELSQSKTEKLMNEKMTLLEKQQVEKKI